MCVYVCAICRFQEKKNHVLPTSIKRIIKNELRLRTVLTCPLTIEFMFEYHRYTRKENHVRYTEKFCKLYFKFGLTLSMHFHCVGRL